MGRGPYFSSSRVIRLQKDGCKNRPFYRIVLMWNRAPRDDKALEYLGVMDPLPNNHGEVVMAADFNRIGQLLGKNAEISTPLKKLFGLAGYFPLHPHMELQARRAQKRMTEDLAKLTAKVPPQSTESDTDKTTEER